MKIEDLFALAVGLFLGGLFAFLRLPIPAPMTVGGILGIIGIAVGAVLVSTFLQR